MREVIVLKDLYLSISDSGKCDFAVMRAGTDTLTRIMDDKVITGKRVENAYGGAMAYDFVTDDGVVYSSLVAIKNNSNMTHFNYDSFADYFSGEDLEKLTLLLNDQKSTSRMPRFALRSISKKVKSLNTMSIENN